MQTPQTKVYAAPPECTPELQSLSNDQTASMVTWEKLLLDLFDLSTPVTVTSLHRLLGALMFRKHFPKSADIHPPGVYAHCSEFCI